MINMKKYINFSIVALMLIGSIGCKKNNLVVDRPALTVAAGEFVLSNYTIAYPVQSTPVALAVPVAVTSIFANDVSIPVTYSSPTGALIGTDFNGPSSVTIKGGKLYDSLRITGVYSQYAGGKKDSVKVKLGGAGIAGVYGRDSVWVILQKYCPVVLADLAGDYPNTAEFKLSGTVYTQTWGAPANPYSAPATVTNLVQTSATTATGTFGNLYDAGWNDITFTMDWTDPSNFKITIPTQSADATTDIRTSSSKPSTFSSCDQTFTLVVDLLDPTTGQPQTGLANYKFVLLR